jgi:hypothetical protein
MLRSRSVPRRISPVTGSRSTSFSRLRLIWSGFILVNATDLPALVNLFFTAELNNLPSSGVESLQANKLMFRF